MFINLSVSWRWQLSLPKRAYILPPLCKGRWFFLGKTGGIDFDKINWFATGYRNINKMSPISQSAAADSSLYQREPCYSFGLKCWLFYSEKLFWATLPVFAKRSHHPSLFKEGKFAICPVLYFIEENKIKAFVYTISQSATADSSLYQREPCNSFGFK